MKIKLHPFTSILVSYYFCSLVVLSSLINSREILDYNPSESFLNVFLKIYDMNLTFQENDHRIHHVLGQFEKNPKTLFDDDFCFQLVIEQIKLGFGPENFFYDRSRRLLVRILLTCPDKRVIIKILEAAEPIERHEMIETMIQTNTVPFLLEILEMRRTTSISFKNILMNKLRS